jgi:hypothetical protein
MKNIGGRGWLWLSRNPEKDFYPERPSGAEGPLFTLPATQARPQPATTSFSFQSEIRAPLTVAKLPQRGLPAADPPAAGKQKLHIVGIELRERIRRRFFKPREPAAEYKLHHVCRTIALLGDS